MKILKKYDNNNNNTSKGNDCKSKITINCPLKGLCNLKNVVYQGIIFPEENIKNKKKQPISEFHRQDGN